MTSAPCGRGISAFLTDAGAAFAAPFGFFAVVEIFSNCYNKGITKEQEVF
jgi:hypothetical protein